MMKVRTLFDVAETFKQKHPNDPLADEYMKSASDFAKDIKLKRVRISRPRTGEGKTNKRSKER